MNKKIDLHLHSIFSDGNLTVEELIKKSIDIKMDVISIVDHDTIDHLIEVKRNEKKYGIKIIPGVEISCEYKNLSLHLLGYFIDSENHELIKALQEQKKIREKRIIDIVKKVKELGFFIDEKNIFSKEFGTIGRPRIAELIIENSNNTQRLEDEKIKSVEEFFQKYLAKDCPAYVNRERIDFVQAIKLIHNAGGIAVWAHPCWNMRKDPSSLELFVDEFVVAGLDGIEVFYTTHSEDDVRRLYAIAIKNNILITAGSDYHGPGREKFPDIFSWNDFGIVWENKL